VVTKFSEIEIKEKSITIKKIARKGRIKSANAIQPTKPNRGRRRAKISVDYLYTNQKTKIQSGLRNIVFS